MRFASLASAPSAAFAVALLVSAGASGCAASLDADPGEGAGGPKATPTVTADPAKLGQPCGYGSDPGTLAATVMSSCGEGVCLVDSRPGREFGAYCSVDCDAKLCPDGYTCEAVAKDRGVARVCTQDPSVCGDGVRQAKEACEDGNVDEDDGCSSTCEVVEPQGLVDAKLVIDGKTLVEGSQPLGYRPAPGVPTCGTYLGQSAVSNETQVVTLAAALCSVDGRRFVFVPDFFKSVSDPVSKLSSTNKTVLVELDTAGEVLRQWDVTADFFEPGSTPAAKITRATVDDRRIVTVSGTISASGKEVNGTTTATLTGTFSFTKLGEPAP